jgi:hypothetical protein
MVCTSTDGARSGALAVTAVSMERGSREPPVSDSCCGTARSHSLLFFFSGWICGVEAAAMWPIQNLLSHPPAASFKFKQFCMYSPLRHEIRRTTSIQQRVGRFQESDPSEKSFFPLPTRSLFHPSLSSLLSSPATGQGGRERGAVLRSRRARIRQWLEAATTPGSPFLRRSRRSARSTGAFFFRVCFSPAGF